MDGQGNTRWWLIAIAALVLVAFVFESVGPIFGIGLFLLSIAGWLGYRHYRGKHPEQPPSIYCLRCGEPLKLTARHCAACGSASWTFKD